MEKMAEPKREIKITYKKEGTTPPLFLAGTHSNWIPQEMPYHESNPGQYTFEKIIQANEDVGNTIQYKFRVGHGDWWVVDEEQPVVTDNAGNQNNILVMEPNNNNLTTSNEMPLNNSEQLKMSDQVTEQPRGEQLVAKPIDAEPEKDTNSEKIPSDEMMNTEMEEDTDASAVSGIAGEEENSQQTAEEDKTETLATENELVPTLIVEKTDNLPSYGEDFGPHATVAEKDACAMRSVDAKPDHVLVQSDTIAEVFDSAALVDEREKTPDIPDEEAGKVGLRRMSTTPIPVVSDTAAEVADIAAVLDREESTTPDIPDEEAGKIGLRRMSSTPIPVVSNIAAEVANIAAVLDREESATPDIPDEEAGKTGFRRMSSTPIPVVSDIAAEVANIAAFLDREESATPDLNNEEAGQIGIRRLSLTPIPVVSDTAAEVAESAALLDREESDTPDVTDEEAGMIGLRRLSMTPISIVAETAAEVADVAASVDKPSQIEIPYSTWLPTGVDDSIEYPEIPEEEKPYLFAHERWSPSYPGESPPKDLPARFMPLPGKKKPSYSTATNSLGGNVPSLPHDYNTNHGSQSRSLSAGSIPKPKLERIELPCDLEEIEAIFADPHLRMPVNAAGFYDPDFPVNRPSRHHDRPADASVDHSPVSRSMSLDRLAEEDDSASAEDDEPPPKDNEKDELVPISKDEGNLSASQYAQISELVEHSTEPEQAHAELVLVSGDYDNPSAISELVDDRDNIEAEPEQILKTLQSVDQSSESEAQPESEPDFASISEKAADESSEKETQTEQIDGNTSSKQVTPAGSTAELVEAGDDEVVSDDTPQTTPPASRDGHEDVAVDPPAIVIHPATPGLSLMEATDSEPEEEASTEEQAGTPAEAQETVSTLARDEIKIHVHTQEEDVIITRTPETPSITAVSTGDDTSSAQGDLVGSAPDLPVETDKSIEADGADGADGAIEAVEPVEPVAAVDPAEPAESVAPVESVGPVEPVKKNTDEEPTDPKSETKAIPVPEEVKVHVHTQKEDMIIISKTASQEASPAQSAGPQTPLVTENTLIRRKPGRASLESESQANDHDSTTPLVQHGDQQEAGLVRALCTAVIGWIGGFFATFCDGGRGKKKKSKEQKKAGMLGGDGGIKTVIGVSALVIAVAVVFVKLVWG